MAIPSNGNFRIRVIWVLREIDGREDDLRALVKTSAKEFLRGVVGPWWIWPQARWWECKPQKQGSGLGPKPKR
jgi:hypothetical protein